MDEEDAWPSSSVSSSGTVDIASAVSEASLRLLSRLVFGFSTSKSFDSQQSNSGAENSLYQGLTYDSLVQRFSDEFLVLWRIIRTNTLMFTPTQTAERINNLTISVRTVKSLLQVLISRRIIILNIRSTIISGSSTSASGGKKDDQSCESEEMQYCLLDGLLPYLKQSIASTNTANVSDTKNSPSSDIMNTNIVSDQCGSVVGSLSSDTKYMTREELIHNLNNLLLAGFETTAHSLIVSLHHLAHCSSEVANLLSLSESNQSQVGSDTSSVGRDQTKKVIVKTLVRESLRLHPPVLQAARVCRQDTPLLLPSISGDISTQSGWMCPEGTPAIIDFIAIMRHTDIWSKIYCEPCTQQNTTSDVISNVNKLNPDVFNLHRWLVASSNHEHKDKDKDKNKDSKQPCPQCEELLELRKQHWIPFGIGPKSCIGRGVALFATEGLLVRLLSHFTFTPPHGTAISNNSSSSSSIYHYRGADSDESYSDKYTLPPVDQTPTLRFTQGLKLHIRVLSPEQPPH